MRMRRKPWARPELKACPFFVENPPDLRGKWNTVFSKPQPVHLELGCGKGDFICKTACDNAETNFIAIDIKSEVLALAKRNITRTYALANRAIDNILLMSFDVARIHLMFSVQDKIDKIYINFPNPWPKERHKKRRLTHCRQLAQYHTFLSDAGIIAFKTDDEALYRDTLLYLSEAGFAIERASENTPFHSGDVLSEHERLFRSQGLPIYSIDAKKQPR